MHDQKCPFSAPLVTEQFACQHAEPVVRRGGAEIACRDDEANRACTSCYERLRQDCLDKLGLEDDLTSLPHSLLHKIQLAGLLELQRQLTAATDLAESVANIHVLIQRADEHFTGIESFPYAAMVNTVAGYKLKRRRAR